MDTSGKNANQVPLFKVAGLKFVVIHLEFNATDDVLQRASVTLRRYRDRRAIINSHMVLVHATNR